MHVIGKKFADLRYFCSMLPSQDVTFFELQLGLSVATLERTHTPERSADSRWR